MPFGVRFALDAGQQFTSSSSICHEPAMLAFYRQCVK